MLRDRTLSRLVLGFALKGTPPETFSTGSTCACAFVALAAKIVDAVQS